MKGGDYFSPCVRAVRLSHLAVRVSHAAVTTPCYGLSACSWRCERNRKAALSHLFTLPRQVYSLTLTVNKATSKHIHTGLVQSWPSVVDGGPTLTQPR